MAPTTNKYCDLTAIHSCSVTDEKCNLQCPKSKIYNRKWQELVTQMQYFFLISLLSEMCAICIDHVYWNYEKPGPKLHVNIQSLCMIEVITNGPNIYTPMKHNDNDPPWASYQIPKIADSACTWNAGNVFPATDFIGNHYACITARASRTCRDAYRYR